MTIPSTGARHIARSLLKKLRFGNSPTAHRRVRRFVPRNLPLDRLFDELNARKASYVVLRWFDDLPSVYPGEDIDFLVADTDLKHFDNLLCAAGPGVPCDVYSVSGLPGSAYKNMAYYPPPLAQEMLNHAGCHRKRYRIPNEHHHFFSLAYHALYHKGSCAGIPTTFCGVSHVSVPDHDYHGILGRLAARLGLGDVRDMESLDLLLAQHGWRPPRDTLSRLAGFNRWIDKRFFAELPPIHDDIKGLTTFVIRKRACDLGLVETILDILKARGFHILFLRRLTGEESDLCSMELRGANWGPGPWPKSGGQPAIIVVAYDLLPSPVSKSLAQRHANLDNARIFETKTFIRNYINATLPEEERCNIVHSSDNVNEALEYLRVAGHTNQSTLLTRIRELKDEFQTPYPVVCALTSNGTRSKVEVVRYRGSDAVCKTFRPGRERFLCREIETLRQFGGVRPEIPTLLETGSNYFIIPFFEGKHWTRTRGWLLPRLMPLRSARSAADVVRFFHSQGRSLIDWHPDQVIIQPNGDIRVVDFELIYEYHQRPECVEDAYEFKGTPDGFEWESSALVTQKEFLKDPYGRRWQRCVGLSATSLLNDPMWLQYLKRGIFTLSVANKRGLRGIARAARVTYSLSKQWARSQSVDPKSPRFAGSSGNGM